MSSSISNPVQSLDVASIRKDFPILSRLVYDKPLVYLDNAASSQKPRAVIEAIEHYYSFDNSNIHRGVHHLSQVATEQYEAAREKVRDFINAEDTKQIIFTKGTTESINLVASSFGRKFVKEGDEILISTMEHHSNIVPWQMICEERGATLKVMPINDEGEIIFEEYLALLNEKTCLVSVSHVSNALGSINPVKEITAAAHKYNIPVLIDGAQAAPHMKIDVQDIGCEFYAFSGHKMYGPTGMGILYGQEKWLEDLPPYQGGGEMIKTVTFEKTTYNELPHKFEGGTPNIAGGIALGVTIDYLNKLGMEAIKAYEEELLSYATQAMLSIDGLRIIGTAKEKASVISFLLEDIHPYDLGTILDKLGFALRTGHHCAEPLMSRMNVPGTIRASFAMYNTKEEVDRLVEAINRAAQMFR